MPCSKPFKYPSYKCYKDIKRQFVERIKESGYDISDYVKDFEKIYEDNELNKLKTLSEIFTNLKKYLSNGHVLFSPSTYNGQGICDYISYLLCKQIRGKYGYCAEQTFNNFKDFVYSYSKYRKSDICSNKLNRLNSDEILKREALYELYDVYNDHQLPHSKEKLSECVRFGHLTRIHNKIVEDYEVNTENIDKNLYEKRIEMKELVNKFQFTPGKCLYYDKFKLNTSKYEEQEIEKKLAEHRKQEAQRLEQEQRLEQARRLEQAQRLEQAKEPTSLSSSENIDSNSRQNEIHTVTEVTGDRHRAHIVTNQHVGTRDNVELSAAGYSRTLRARGDYDNSLVIQHGDKFYPPKISVDSQLNAENPNSEDGIIGSMRNTLSRIVQNVDPLPVVGVSGGMGALFLLFRYTPVGAFFRGGRGRVRRIPSGFHGQFQGGFPGYEDYDGGFIGYSPMNINPLAE